MIKKIIFVLGFITISFLELFSQELKITVTEINDIRTNRKNSECQLKIKFIGAQIQGGIYVKLDTIIKAIDDQDKNLLNNKLLSSQCNILKSKNATSDQFDLELKLKSPNRTAATIKLINGTISVYDPHKDLESEKSIKNFINNTNVSLISKKVNQDFDILILNKSLFSKFKKEEKELLYKKLKSYSGHDIDTMGVKSFMETFFDNFSYNDSPNYVNFYVYDKGNELIGFKFYNEKGEEMKTKEKYTLNNSYYTFGFDKPITKEWTVVIQRMTTKSLKKLVFEINNIQLP